MSSERTLLGLVFAIGLVLLLAALSLLRAANGRDVVLAGEVRARPRPAAHGAPEVATRLVLPEAGGALEPVATPASAPTPSPAADDADPRLEPAPARAPAPAPDAIPPPPAAAGGLLSGTVVDGASGAPCEAEIWLSIPGSPSTNLVLQAVGGTFEQRVERPGSYCLVARCDGKVAVLRDVPVSAGGRTEDLVLTLREAARVRVAGRDEGEAAWTCTLLQQGTTVGLIVGAKDAELAVPPGALTARLLVLATGERRETTLTAAPGELTVIRFD